MKLRIMFLVFLLVIPFVNSEEISFFRDQLSYEEVLQLEVNFDLKPEEFRAGAVRLITPSDEEIKPAILFNKIDDKKYFISMEIPTSFEEGEYSLILKDLKFIIDGSLEFRTFSKNFNVVDQENSILVLPSYIRNPSPKFHLNIRSVRSDNVLQFEVPEFIEHIYNEELVEEGKRRRFVFDVKTKDFDYGEVKIITNGKEFAVPIYGEPKKEVLIPGEIVEEIEETMEVEEGVVLVFLTNVTVLERTIKKDEILEGPLSFKNVGEEVLENLKFSLTGNLDEVVSINLSSVEKLEPGEVRTQFVIINDDLDIELDEYSGSLVLNNDEVYVEIPFVIEVLSEEVLETVKESTEEFIEERGIGEAEIYPTVSEPKGLGSIFLIIILIIVGIVIYVLTRKTKEKTPFKDYLKQIKK